ncbi:MAG: hypothetical protein GX815_11425 [Clostridiales bacterium]|nr:hypothetical protein [Clostridiales bacterium]
MKLTIKISTSRSNIDIDSNIFFKDNIGEYDKYSFSFFMSIGDNGSNIGEVKGRVFDEREILNDGEDLVYISDMYNQDVYSAIEKLIKSKVYKEELDEDLIFENPYLCYIDRVYIEPKYRKLGIAKYIFKNLYTILLHTLMIHIRCFVIYPQPQVRTEERWVDQEDPNNVMKKVMTKVIKNAGYRVIGRNSGYYAINCMTGNERI